MAAVILWEWRDLNHKYNKPNEHIPLSFTSHKKSFHNSLAQAEGAVNYGNTFHKHFNALLFMNFRHHSLARSKSAKKETAVFTSGPGILPHTGSLKHTGVSERIHTATREKRCLTHSIPQLMMQKSWMFVPPAGASWSSVSCSAWQWFCNIHTVWDLHVHPDNPSLLLCPGPHAPRSYA